MTYRTIVADPAHAGTTGYGSDRDLAAYATQYGCRVSEAMPLSKEAVIADSGIPPRVRV